MKPTQFLSALAVVCLLSQCTNPPPAPGDKDIHGRKQTNAYREGYHHGFMDGSHKLGPLATEPDGLYLSPRRFPIAEATPCPAEAGDLLIITYLTIHGSGVNTSPEARTTCLFQLRDPTDKPTKDTHRSRGQGMMLRGIDPDA